MNTQACSHLCPPCGGSRAALRRGPRAVALFAAISAAAFLAGCSTTAPVATTAAPAPARAVAPSGDYFALEGEHQTQEMVLFALGLLDTGYRFGGRNPDAGLDCSGMVAYIVENISGRKLPHNAAQIADRTRPIDVSELRPGDLVFFNTNNRPFSHVGIYIGDARFIHAPSTNGKVRIDRLADRYYAQRYEAARTFFD